MNAKGSGADPSENNQTPVKDGVALTPGDAKAEGVREKAVENTRTKAAGTSPNKAPAAGASGKEQGSEGEGKKKKGDDPSFGARISEARQFLKEVYWEFRKISWPSRSQVIRETYSVIFLVTVITVMVLAFDYVVGKGIFDPLDKFAKQFRYPGGAELAPPAPTSVPAPASTPAHDHAVPSGQSSQPSQSGKVEGELPGGASDVAPEGNQPSESTTPGTGESTTEGSTGSGQAPAPSKQKETAR